MASVSAAVDVNGSIVSVNESSTIQDGLDAHGANNTIYLNNNSYNGTGNSNFSISDRNVTIIGNGTWGTVISGSKNNWFISATNTNLKLINLTLSNFFKNGNGAVVDKSGFGSLTIINCSVINNSVREGSVIYDTTNNSFIDISNSIFNNNSATRYNGGAIYTSGNNSSFNGCNLTFTNNYANGLD